MTRESPIASPRWSRLGLRHGLAIPIAGLLLTGPATVHAQETDTTLAARPDARIQIQNFAGSVTVRAWNRNAIRIVAGPRRRDEVRIRGNDATISISTVNRSGVPAPLDYVISVPAGASLDVGGTYTDITITGAGASVRANTVQGAVSLRGGDGVISVKSVQGSVTVEDARGRIEANSVNRGVVVRNVSGDIATETVNGSILLDSIQSSDVEAVTVNGRVSYQGTIRDGGRYRFGSHNGAIIVSIPERANATIAAMTYEGTFSSRFAVPGGGAGIPARTRRPVTFALGTGSARVETESFQGNIVLARPGDPVFRER
jgi:hypothetical protein